MMSKLQMEKRWGIKIVNREYWNILRQRFMNDYFVYSADGCTWDKGFKNLKQVEDMCRTDSELLLSIKDKVAQEKRITAMRLAEQSEN